MKAVVLKRNAFLSYRETDLREVPGWYRIKVAFAGTVMAYLPSAPVTTPLVVPLTTTAAPSRGVPEMSVIVPPTEMFCAKADTLASRSAAVMKKALIFLISIRTG